MPVILEPRTDEQRRATCPRCGAVIGYYETEVRYWLVKPRPGKWGRIQPGIGFDHIECPSCESIIRLDEHAADQD